MLEGRQPSRALERGTVNGASGCALLIAEEEELDAGARRQRDLQKGGAMDGGVRARRSKGVQDGGIRAWSVQSG